MTDDLLTPTPYHQLKPRLEWVGKLLGMDVYVDTRLNHQSDAKRQLAQDILTKVTDLVSNNPDANTDSSNPPKDGLTK